MTGTLSLTESDLYTFDAAAADRPIRFVEKFCRHYEGQFAGQPFLLHDVQKKIIRDVFGWKHRSTGLRRFTDVYLEGAIGSGKSPLLAALGLYSLMADGEQGAQVYSLASSYEQARVVFDTAKRFVAYSPDLRCRLKVIERKIQHPASGSTWSVVSGDGPGAGRKPSLILGDECWQWAGAGAYHDLHDRMAKRRQPLCIVATNAGESQSSFCWQLREKAVAALGGRGDEALYPVIWAADDATPTDDPAGWLAANPLLGVTVAESNVAANCAESMGDDEQERNFRRLYMGVWPSQATGRWLNMDQWDDCTGALIIPQDAALYVGLDMSAGDDLCAVIPVWVTANRFYVDAKFWLPRETADKYEKKHATPYTQWGKAGHIELLNESTISLDVQSRIAEYIVGLSKSYDLKAVCFDRAYVGQTVAAVEAKGITIVPVGQGWGVTHGTTELGRRVKERSITLSANPVLRFCAENVEVKTDERGNQWPVKPDASGKYAGKRAMKIDGISALVTALTEARKHAFPAPVKLWKGFVQVA